MLLKFNIKLYSGNKSLFFYEVIACQTWIPKKINVLKMIKKSTPFLSFRGKMQNKHVFFYYFIQRHL